MKKIYFKSNLKHLIKLYEDSYLNLAIYLGYSSDSAIWNIINRSNNDYPSDPQLIDKICLRYKITKEALLYEDLSNMSKAYVFEVDEKIQKEFYLSVFPIIKPKEDDCKNFKEAYKLHWDLFQQTDILKDVSQEFFYILDLYQKALDEDNCLSALANMMNILVLERSQLNKQSQIEGYIKLKNNTISQKTYKRDYVLDNQNIDSERIDTDDLDTFILECITELKKHEEYISFAEFYQAIRYFLNIAYDDLDDATSASISGYLLQDLERINNKYAVNFIIHKQALESNLFKTSQSVKEN